jgi:hypothetical protein
MGNMEISYVTAVLWTVLQWQFVPPFKEYLLYIIGTNKNIYVELLGIWVQKTKILIH